MPPADRGVVQDEVGRRAAADHGEGEAGLAHRHDGPAVGRVTQSGPRTPQAARNWSSPESSIPRLPGRRSTSTPVAPDHNRIPYIPTPYLRVAAASRLPAASPAATIGPARPRRPGPGPVGRPAFDPAATTMPRIAELDAIRALAALAILLFHLDPPRFYPGWSGVDLFFVLSGYLITAIILNDGRSERFLPRFYMRRTLRIWPIYYLTLLIVLAANAASPRPLPAGGWARYATYTQNLGLLWRHPDPPFPPAFDHAWTLALEEQFYLIWPALVLRVGRRGLVPLALFVAALAVAMRTGGYVSAAPFSERVLPARCDGFALGGLLAAALPRPGSAGPATRAALAAASAVALGYLVAGARSGGSGFIGLPTPAAPGATIFAFAVLYAGLIGGVVAHAGAAPLAPASRGVDRLSRPDQLRDLPVSLPDLLVLRRVLAVARPSLAVRVGQGRPERRRGGDLLAPGGAPHSGPEGPLRL